jgi:hypothetical protein
MNRWIYRTLVTAGFAGAVWAIGTAAASAGTTTAPTDAVPARPATPVVTLDVDLGLGHRTDSTNRTTHTDPAAIATARANGGTIGGLAGEVRVTVTRPARHHTGSASTTASTSDGKGSATVTAAATLGRTVPAQEAPTGVGAAALLAIGRSTEDTQNPEEPANGEESATGAGVHLVVTIGTGPQGEQEEQEEADTDTGSGSGNGTATEPGSAGTADPTTTALADGADAGLVTTTSLAGTASATTASVMPPSLARTGSGAAGLALVALMMILAGAAIRRLNARR